MELGPQNLGEIHPAVRTFERFGGPRASKFSGPRGKQKKTIQTPHLQRIRCFFQHTNSRSFKTNLRSAVGHPVDHL